MFEGRGLSTILADPGVVAASAGFVRVLVRFPEAYWLVKLYDVQPPCVLFLDGAGRKLGDLTLDADKPGESAKALSAAAAKALAVKPGTGSAPKTVDVKLTLAAAPAPDRIDALRAALEARGGLIKLAAKGKTVTITACALFADPARYVEAAKQAGLTAEPPTLARGTVPVDALPPTPITQKKVMELIEVKGIAEAWPDVKQRAIHILYDRTKLPPEDLAFAVLQTGLNPREAGDK